MNHRRGRSTDASSEAMPRRPSKSAKRPVPGGAATGPVGATAGYSLALRVLCVDDHPVLVEGLRAQFAIDGTIEVVGHLPSATRLAEEVERLRPSAVLLDIEMPGADVFEMADRLRRSHPEVRVIVLSAHVRDSFISAAFSSGACAYFAKSDDLKDIVLGIREAMLGPSGSFVLGPKVRERCQSIAADASVDARRRPARQNVSVMRSGAPMTLLASLTSREAEILRLIGRGLSRTQIAAQLCRSAKTVDGHQNRMMKKLGIPARADLLRFAIREGLAEI